MVEQIILKNDYEWQALELLKRQTYAHAKRFETRFVITTGLLQDMKQAFTPSDGRTSPTLSSQVRIS